MDKRDDFLDPKRLEEQMESVPAFMTKLNLEGELPPLVEALQSLKYAEDDPDECAESYKQDGNANYKIKKYRWAVECYDKALKLNITKMELKSALFFNRAVANFQLKNYRKTITDCEEALLINPAYLKAVLKGAESLFALEKFSQAKEWIARGLVLDSENTHLLQLRKKVETEEKKQFLNERKHRKQQEKTDSLRSAIAQRGIRLRPVNPWAGDHIATTPGESTVSLGVDGRLIWPLRLMFPEFQQQEFVEQVEEDVTLQSVLEMVLDKNPPLWDTRLEYTSSKACCYYFENDAMVARQVAKETTLKKLLILDSYYVENLMPTLFVLSTISDFSKKYLTPYTEIGAP